MNSWDILMPPMQFYITFSVVMAMSAYTVYQDSIAKTRWTPTSFAVVLLHFLALIIAASVIIFLILADLFQLELPRAISKIILSVHLITLCLMIISICIMLASIIRQKGGKRTKENVKSDSIKIEKKK